MIKFNAEEKLETVKEYSKGNENLHLLLIHNHVLQAYNQTETLIAAKKP